MRNAPVALSRGPRTNQQAASENATRTALQNASSIAGVLLTTEAVVTEKPEKQQAGGGGGGGGMGDMY